MTRPRIYKANHHWWNIRYFDVRRKQYHTIFADSWKEAVELVKHGYQEGYI